jgi:hypothetical protein
MRRLVFALVLALLACTLAGCPFFTRGDAPAGADAPNAGAPAEAAAE